MMPVFRDPDRRYSHRPISGESRSRSPERKYRAQGSEMWALATVDPEDAEAPEEESFGRSDLLHIKSTSSREELIECLKRGEHPRWIPSRNMGESSTGSAGQDTSPEITEGFQRNLLPAVEILGDVERPPTPSTLASQIERPRSALHSGDFRAQSPTPPTLQNPFIPHSGENNGSQSFLGSSPTTPWYTPAPRPLPRRFGSELVSEETRPFETVVRSRAPSLGSSLSNSFAYRPPTSPLVHSATNPALDFTSRTDVEPIPIATDTSSRRRTLPPETFQSLRHSPQSSRLANYSRPLPNLRRENSLPYQAHQPRRSLNSNSFHDAMGLSTPSTRSRRPSFSEVSPHQHASMVGSYEESILRGRMSTTPSKPLDFVAQIGVLGKGDCPPALKCPAHVTVPFPAVFYSYGSSSGRSTISDDSPSPYVGNIDLEHNLNPVQDKSRRKTGRQTQASGEDAQMTDIAAPENTPIGIQIERRKREKRRRRSQSPKAPIGGCYRIPQQGQLQIIIKNPNKTAVKLYLIPYDLEGMEPGTKTFVRQRSYSAGPILDTPLSANGFAAIPVYEKPILRYLVHLRICCPSKNRFYLYDNIRVVFANRVPDGKEKLRNEIQLPEPRYSVWKPNRDTPPVGSAGARLAADKAFRRRSSGFGTSSQFGFGDIDGLGGGFDTALSFAGHTTTPPPVPSLPTHPHYSLPQRHDVHIATRMSDREIQQPIPPMTSTQRMSPPSTSSSDQNPTFQTISGFNPPPPSLRSASPLLSSPQISSQNGGTGSPSSTSDSSGPYAKLRRHEGRYGSPSAEGFQFPGLLAQRLKALEVKNLKPEEDGRDRDPTVADVDMFTDGSSK